MNVRWIRLCTFIPVGQVCNIKTYKNAFDEGELIEKENVKKMHVAYSERESRRRVGKHMVDFRIETSYNFDI